MKLFGASRVNLSGMVYLVWDIPHDKINSYQVYRNGILLADSTNPEQANLFKKPTVFDHDHWTNLFRKITSHQMMFLDEGTHKYQKYKYHVVAQAISDSGVITDKQISNILLITSE